MDDVDIDSNTRVVAGADVGVVVDVVVVVFDVYVDSDRRVVAGEPGLLRGQSKSGEQKVDPGGNLKMQRRQQFSIKK